MAKKENKTGVMAGFSFGDTNGMDKISFEDSLSTELSEKIIEPVIIQSTFDYSQLDSESEMLLKEKARIISQIKVKTVHDIGMELSIAHEHLSNHKNGTFGNWCESIGINRRTAENYMQAYRYVTKNFRNIEDAAGIQPSLLFAASKPSAPPELSQAVIAGDILKHKDYVEALEKIKELEKEKEKNEENLSQSLTSNENQKKLTHDWKVQAINDAEENNRLQNEIENLNGQIESLKKNSKPLMETSKHEESKVISEPKDNLDKQNLDESLVNYEDELKPCPFCGCELKEYPMVMTIEKQRINPDTVQIKCPSCSASSGGGWSKEEAVKRWNTRESD